MLRTITHTICKYVIKYLYLQCIQMTVRDLDLLKRLICKKKKDLHCRIDNSKKMFF